MRKRMIRFGRQLMFFTAGILALSLAVFCAARLAPGDPLISYYGDRVEKMSPEERMWAEERLGLAEPIPVQYIRWFGNALRGDFGISFKYKTDVLEVIGERIPNTLLLGGTGFVLIFVLALFLGIFCAWFENRWPDKIICRLGTVTSCIPEFWIALIFILIFSVRLKLLPGSGAYCAGKAKDVGDRILHLILPLGIVVMSHLWYYACMIRNRFLTEIRAEYALFARAKGLDRKTILFRHCLRNMIPFYLSIMSISVPHILGGTYIIETVFSYPGIGTLAYESARYKDYNLLMILCILSGGIVILCNLISQLINEYVDPRIRADAVPEASEVKNGA